MRSASKELFIIALLLMIVVFMIGMVFYKYMPNNKTVPEPVTYTADSTTTAVLQEISASSGSYGDESYGENEVVQDVIKSYSIGQSELTTAAAKQTYVSGKTNPFEEYKEPAANTVDGNTAQNTNTVAPNQNPNTNPNQQQAQPEPAQAKTDPNSTGTFFEKKGSK